MKKILKTVLIALVMVGITLMAATQSVAEETSQQEIVKKKVIIDTDMGWDDTLSILFLMKDPRVEIIGITVTGCGETFQKPGLHNALALLQMGGIDAPVCEGIDKPATFGHVFPKSFKDDMSDLMGLAATYPKLTTEISDKSAWDFIADTLNASDEKITILSIGGFANLGKMLEERPDAKLENIEMVYTMGGAVHVDGNIALLNDAVKEWDQGPIYSTNFKAEWNIFVAPTAAKAVFNSIIPITLVPLDACDYVMLQPSYIDRITGTDPIAALVKQIFVKKTGTSSEGIPVPIFDPLSALIMSGAMNPNQILSLNLDVSVIETKVGNKCGQTYISNLATDKLIQVVQGVSDRAFADAFAKVVNSNKN